MGTKNSLRSEIDGHINRARLLSIELYTVLAVVLFSLGFAVFINSAVRILSFDNPWKALIFALILMIIPLAFGIWKIEKGKREFLGRLMNIRTT